MKIKVTLAPILAVLALNAGTPAKDLDMGILINQAQTNFTNGSAIGNLTTGDKVRMTGNGSFVSLDSASLSFSQYTISPLDLALADLANVTDGDILTITATSMHNAAETYSVGFIKHMQGNKAVLRMVSVHAIPEPEAFAMIAGLLALTSVALKRRQLNK